MPSRAEHCSNVPRKIVKRHADNHCLKFNFAQIANQFRPFCSAISAVLVCNFAHFTNSIHAEQHTADSIMSYYLDVRILFSTFAS